MFTNNKPVVHHHNPNEYKNSNKNAKRSRRKKNQRKNDEQTNKESEIDWHPLVIAGCAQNPNKTVSKTAR